MSSEADKNFKPQIRNVTDQPNSEEALSEALLEEELLAAEMDSVNNPKAHPMGIAPTSTTTVPTTDLDISEDLANTLGEAAVGGLLSPSVENRDDIIASPETETHWQEDQ